jgi:hypothetical protein
MTTMTETREFPTAVVASLSTGIMLCDGGFSKMHEAAEFLMGHPIWTHHFASEELWSDLRRMLLEQCPGLPTEDHGITKENYKEKLAALEAEIGPTVRIRKGDGLTAMLPTDGIPDHLKDKTIVLKV